MTIARRALRHCSMFFRVTEGWVKSIRTSNSSQTLPRSPDSGTPIRRDRPARRRPPPHQGAIRTIHRRRQPGGTWSAERPRSGFLPMRPAAPTTAIRRIKPLHAEPGRGGQAAPMALFIGRRRNASCLRTSHWPLGECEVSLCNDFCGTPRAARAGASGSPGFHHHLAHQVAAAAALTGATPLPRRRKACRSGCFPESSA